MPLTDRQRRFVDAYMLDPNGKAAAITAGYSPRTADVQASRLLSHVHVAAELAQRRQQVVAATGITPEMVLMELAKLGFSDIRKVVSWQTKTVDVEMDADTGAIAPTVQSEVILRASDELDDATAAAVSEVSQTKEGMLKVKMHDKLQPLVKIGQHLGMFRPLSKDELPGKKEQRDRDAETAEQGTGWDGLLQ